MQNNQGFRLPPESRAEREGRGYTYPIDDQGTTAVGYHPPAPAIHLDELLRINQRRLELQRLLETPNASVSPSHLDPQMNQARAELQALTEREAVLQNMVSNYTGTVRGTAEGPNVVQRILGSLFGGQQ